MNPHMPTTPDKSYIRIPLDTRFEVSIADVVALFSPEEWQSTSTKPEYRLENSADTTLELRQITNRFVPNVVDRIKGNYLAAFMNAPQEFEGITVTVVPVEDSSSTEIEQLTISVSATIVMEAVMPSVAMPTMVGVIGSDLEVEGDTIPDMAVEGVEIVEDANIDEDEDEDEFDFGDVALVEYDNDFGDEDEDANVEDEVALGEGGHDFAAEVSDRLDALDAELSAEFTGGETQSEPVVEETQPAETTIEGPIESMETSEPDFEVLDLDEVMEEDLTEAQLPVEGSGEPADAEPQVVADPVLEMGGPGLPEEHASQLEVPTVGTTLPRG